jgi:hypothetical protein
MRAKTRAIENQPRRLRLKIWIWIAACLLIFAVLSALAAPWAKPYVRRRLIALLSEKFQGDVEVGDLGVAIRFPIIRIRASNLTVEHLGRSDVPALISARELIAEASLWSLIGKPSKVDRVELEGLVVRIPPKGAPSSASNSPARAWSLLRDAPILIGKIEANDAQLELLSSKPDKAPRIFVIHQLVLQHVGLHRAAAFQAKLTNLRPPGEIDSRGQFGPWNALDPAQTPLAATYSFAHADLGVFKGISGILSSQGTYGGVLSKIEVEGETDTPNFTLTRSGTPVALHTTFSATVDGTNGNTLLHPVRAHFLNSNVIAQGEVVQLPKGRGHEVKLNLVVEHARLEDVLRLGVKSESPFMTGELQFRSAFDLSPGEGEVMQRLHLAGRFGVEGSRFTNPKLAQRVATFSRKAQGRPKDQDLGSDVSTLAGNFALGEGMLHLDRLSFAVTGAQVALDGSYGLHSGSLDFHGKLRLDAKLSQTMTGYKSVLLLPFNSFFRKQNVTEIPIRIGGTREYPSFGLDFHRAPGARRQSARQ